GNFTGIRISVAAARGLALSLGIPAVGVTATEAAACDAPRPCRAIVALRGDEVVWQDFPALLGKSRAAHDPMPDDTSSGPALARRETLPAGPAACRSPHSLPVAIALLAARRVTARAGRGVTARDEIPRP